MVSVTHSCPFLKVPYIQVAKENHNKKWCRVSSLGALKLLALMKILTHVCPQYSFFLSHFCGFLFLQNFDQPQSSNSPPSVAAVFIMGKKKKSLFRGI